jgi:hypothetical protein
MLLNRSYAIDCKKKKKKKKTKGNEQANGRRGGVGGGSGLEEEETTINLCGVISLLHHRSLRRRTCRVSHTESISKRRWRSYVQVRGVH